jgi:2-iminoacetate synthase ThiH
MLQGGHHPDFGVDYYEALFGAVSQAYPQLVIHSIGPSEILHMAKVSGVPVDEALTRIHTAGLDSIAGAGAEMLPARPRTAIAPLKESGEEWLSVMEQAHRQGIESTATMMMGTGETNAERVEHLRMIRDVQDRTGGFRSFIPWTYQPENNHLRGRPRPPPGVPPVGRGRPAVLRQRGAPAVVWLTTGRTSASCRCTWASTTSAPSCWRRTSSPPRVPGTGRTCSTSCG